MPGINIGALVLKAVTSFIISTLLQAVVSAIFGRKSTASDFDFKAFEQIIRAPVAPRRVIYGQKLVSGPLLFATTTDNDKFLHLVVAHTGHECHDATDLYVNDQRVPPRDFSGDDVNAGDFSGFVRRTVHLGNELQTFDAALGADVADWTSAHRLAGVCYTRFRLKANEVVFRNVPQPPREPAAVGDRGDISLSSRPASAPSEPFIPFPAGIPNLRVLMRGRKVWDPRDSGLAIASSTFLTAGQVEIETATAHGKTAGDRIFIAGHAQEQENVIFGEYHVVSVSGPRFLTVDQVTDTITGVGTGGTLYDMNLSHNPVLCVLDYLVNKDFGRESPENFLNLTQIKAAANTCDEQVAVTESVDIWTADATDDILFRSDPLCPINTGSLIRLSTTDTLPAPLAPETDYYYVHRGVLAEFGLATSYANAQRGIFITVTDAGTGAHTFTRFSQPRYTCNGAFTVDAQPIDIVGDLLTSCLGSVVNISGQFHIFVGEPGTATFTLTPEHFRAEIDIETDANAREVFNRVTGIFISPDNFWQAADFPAQSRKQFVIDDGAEITRDIELRFTNDQLEAQRIATIHLLQSRSATAVTVRTNLNAMVVQPWDVIAFDNSQAGWSAKEFRVLGWKMVPDGKGVGLDIDLQEYDPDVYVWAGGEVCLAVPPEVQLPAALPPDNEPDLQPGSGRSECRINGLIDTFPDETGIDQSLSANNAYDAANTLYKPG